MTRTREEGVASTYVMSIALLLLTVSTVCLFAVLLIGLNQRAAQGADFAALAASKASVDDKPACQSARRIARANGVRIVTCRMDAEVATVTTRAELNTPFGAWGVKARARAAPDYYFE